MTRADYLRARGWGRFRGDERWYPQESMDGISEEEAERIQLDIDKAALRYMLERRPGVLAGYVDPVGVLPLGVAGVAVLSGGTEPVAANLGPAAEPPAADDLDGEAGK